MSWLKYNTHFQCLLLILLALCGCAEPPKDQQLIEETRVVGLRISGRGDSALIEPNEDFELSLLLLGTDGPLKGELAFELCETPEQDRGVPLCSGTPLLEGLAPAGDGSLSLSGPPELEAGSSIAILGVVCLQSRPYLAADPRDWHCEGEEQPLRFSFDTVVGDGEIQRNPELTELAVFSDEQPVLLDGSPMEGQCPDDAFVLRPSSEVELRLSLPDETRDPEEVIQFSHLSTGGLLERAFTIIEAPPLDTRISFKAPDVEGPVQHFVVVRDDRGGVSWRSWTMCVVAP